MTASINGTNEDLLQMRLSLEPLLKRRDVIGWTAAINHRMLSEKTVDYERIRNELVAKYGKQEVGEDGNATGNYVIDADSPEFKQFIDSISEVASINQCVSVRTLRMGDVCGAMSGEEMLSCWWMLEEDDEGPSERVEA